ncbi:hypothetical protein [Tenggerimyces flavus]|uniref:Radical SAM protein n=1 Tax=Tenggerimyces flavus TaxID=1708749 RepID=A0ABV7YNR1_9ACTN|nr:hypothetical protein [Tenggerimyces flavus]MBM7789564.1 hypothetical protein [Tenggerimyces flavus]
MSVLNWYDAHELAKRYGVCFDDVLMIALNVFGARSDPGFPRARMLMHLRSRPEEPLRQGLPLARANSPFLVRGDQLFFDNQLIADLEEVEHDDALWGYFRNHCRVLVLNSNARSQCTGCVFCPNTLEGASDPRLAVLDDLDQCFSIIEAEQSWSDMSGLDEVNVVTGCFHWEEPAIDHLAMVREALAKHGGKAQLGMLSSVIRTEAGMDRIAEEVAPFFLVMTLECFTNRSAILKHSKASLRPEEVPRILVAARDRGFQATFTYIVGLEPIDVVREALFELSQVVTKFPDFQVFQAHNKFMESFGTRGSDQLEFYLQARRQLEQMFRDLPLRPQTWANYRSLWYYEFAGEELSGARH